MVGKTTKHIEFNVKQLPALDWRTADNLEAITVIQPGKGGLGENHSNPAEDRWITVIRNFSKGGL